MKKLAATAAVALMALTGCSSPQANEYVPCPNENSFNCIWDASTMGNGKGTSFISGNSADATYPVPHHVAQDLLGQ